MPVTKKQAACIEPLFEIDNEWQKEWQGMPEYSHQDLSPYRSLIVHFATPEDAKAFAKLIGQSIGEKNQSIWFPQAAIDRYMDKRYSNES